MQAMVPAGADVIWAEDSGGDRPPLVLLHEHVADSRMWDPVWPELEAEYGALAAAGDTGGITGLYCR